LDFTFVWTQASFDIRLWMSSNIKSQGIKNQEIHTSNFKHLSNIITKLSVSIFVRRISPPFLHVENSITTWLKGFFLETNSLVFIFLSFLSGLHQMRFSTFLGLIRCRQGLIYTKAQCSAPISLCQHCSIRKLRLEINKNLLTANFPECSKCVVTKTLISIKFKK